MLSLSHTGVQTLLFSLCKGCSFKEPGETACDSHPTTLELHRSVIGEERTAALPDLLRYSDIKDELFHFLSVKPFMHEAHTPFTGTAVRMNVGGPRTQPRGDELLSEGTHWLSPRWRGKSSSLSVLVVNKLEVLYQPLRALHHDESECYKVLIIKTCQCVCVFSKALVWWYQSGTMMVQQPHSARYCEDMIQQICTFPPGMEGPAACHTFTLSGSPCIQ